MVTFFSQLYAIILHLIKVHGCHQLHIHVDVQPNDTQPSFLVVPQNTTAEVGDKVVLECAGRGSPPPLVEWYREHSRHFPHTGKVLPVGALVFDSITAEDTGLYHCGVSNDVSEIQAVVFVDVRGQLL